MPRLVALLLAVLLILACCAGEPEAIPEPEPVGWRVAGTPTEEIPPYGASQRFTLAVTGDLMVHGEQLGDALDPESGRYDFGHCFAQVAGDLGEADLAIGNLETVLAGEAAGYSDYPRFNTPDNFAEALAGAGYDFLTTANNHCMDQDEAGLLRTLEVLDRLDLNHTGTFASPEEREALQLVEVGEARIALFSYTFSTNGIPVPQDKDYLVNMIEEERIISDLSRAREAGADLIVVLPHMGNEYETYPRDPFINWMDRMIYYGADLVLASHPHVLQPMEVKEVTDVFGQTRTAFVIYSLGNFLSSQRYEPRETGILLKLDFSRRGDERAVLEAVRFVPTWVQFYDASGAQLVRVLPMADALADWAGDNTLSLRPQDADRLLRAHGEVTRLYLGQAVSREEMQREYLFYRREG